MLTYFSKIGQFIVDFTDFVCGYPLFILLIGGGLFLFIYSGALPIRMLPEAMRSLKMRQKGEGQISSFQALMSTISSTVGLGNIAGVAIALVVGGPGAIFWMWVSAILGMATKFHEGVLAIKYKGTDANGEAQGGPMYVITEGLGKKWKPLAILFAAAGMIGSLVLMQANQLCEAITNICIVPALGITDSSTLRFCVGLGVGSLVAIVVLGGIQRIAKVATRMVPFMVGCYFLMVTCIIIANFNLLPGVFATIFKEAFSMQAGIGGIIGVALIGARRAMYVNEAGVGTAGMMHGASMNEEPIREGLVAMLGPAIDSGFVCTLTAIPIIMADNYHVEGVQGLSVALEAYDILIPNVGRYFLMFMVVVFALSTMFSYSYYGTKCTTYLFGEKIGKWYVYFYIFSIIISSILTLDVAISIMDLAFAIMTFPNMIAVFTLSNKVKEEVTKYTQNQKTLFIGIND